MAASTASTRVVRRTIAMPASERSQTRGGVAYLQLALLVIAGALLIGSILLPYWEITLRAPQYPKGLFIQAYVFEMRDAKNVFEVDGLNHYIGMIKLSEAARLEQTISRFAIPLVAVLAVASFWLRGVWRVIARVPIIIYPIVFVIDLFAWLYYAGHSLDPHAPLSSAIHEFTPRIVGVGTIGQFGTQANFALGFYLAVAAALIVVVVATIGRGTRRASR